MDAVEAWSRRVTTQQCLTELNGHGVPSAAYRTVKEALADPQLDHRGALAEVEDGGGTFRVLNLPFRMSGARVSAAPKMATLGEHTRAYLKETGLTEDEIATFSGNWRRGADRVCQSTVTGPAAFHPQRLLWSCRSGRFQPI